MTFKTEEMLRDEAFQIKECLISEFVDAKFNGNQQKAEIALNKLFPSPSPKPNFSFSIITRDGSFLCFSSKKEMQEWLGL